MKTYHHIHIYKKTFLLLLLSIILSSSLVGMAAYQISVSILTEKLRSSYENSSRFVANTVENQLTQITHLSDYIFFDRQVKELLVMTDKTSYSYIKLQEQIEERLASYLHFTSDENFPVIQLYNQNGRALSLSISPFTFYNQDAIMKKLEKKKLDWNTKLEIENLNTYYTKKKGTPEPASYTIVRPITSRYFDDIIGGMFICISPDLFSNVDSLYNHNRNQQIYLLNEKNEFMNRLPKPEDQMILAELNLAEDPSEKTILDQATVFCYVLPETDWKVVSILSHKELTQGNRTILYTTAVSFLLSLLLTSLLCRFLTLRIFHPLEVLQNTVSKIQHGETNTRIPLLIDDEIGELSRNFNFMLDKLESSHQRELEKQKKLQTAQYHALQTSINPHFLYNTLNTIRWMAAIQKADNIKVVVEKLTSLLRSTVKQNAASHCIGSELQTLNDYLFIQQLAYSQRFSIQRNLDESLNDYPCIPFILQPLAENSIFHGVMARESAGIIKISSKKTQWIGKPAIEIEIWDNGKGIEPEKIKDILEKDSFNKYGLNGIGVSNVNERLILTYGKSYSLQISSKIDCYTSVIVHIPLSEN